jgi:cysteine synthase A
MGAYLGLKVEIYMPKWLSNERKRLLEFYGAKLVQISAKQGGFEACIARAAKKSQQKGYFGPKQFNNVWNVMAHKGSTAPEFHHSLQSIDRKGLDIFTAGVGTGGTIMGFYHYFSELDDGFEAFPIFPTKNTDGGHRIEGIGDSFVPQILDLSSLGSTLRVKDSDALNIARQLNRLGLSTGISSGANVYGALCKTQMNPGLLTVGTILCDDNKKYLSTDLCSQSVENLSRDIKILDFRKIP